MNIRTLIRLLFQPSSLQELTLNLDLQDIVLHDELLPHENTNLKELTISRNLLHQLAALINEYTSLTYLWIRFYSLQDSDLPVLTNIVRSHHTLEELCIGFISCDNYETELLQLIEAAGNGRLKKLILYKPNYIIVRQRIRGSTRFRSPRAVAI